MEQQTPAFELLLQFFKTLADENRLRIIGLLSEQRLSVGDLAELLNLRGPTVSHHLARLQELGLVNMVAEGTTHLYTLNTDMLRQLSEQILKPERIIATTEAHVSDNDAKILQIFLDGERIKQLPASFKKKLPILRWTAEHFQHDQRYSEKEVNTILRPLYDDISTLRRELIATRFMARESGFYWRLPEAETNEHLTIMLESKPLKQASGAE